MDLDQSGWNGVLVTDRIRVQSFPSIVWYDDEAPRYLWICKGSRLDIMKCLNQEMLIFVLSINIFMVCWICDWKSNNSDPDMVQSMNIV